MGCMLWIMPYTYKTQKTPHKHITEQRHNIRYKSLFNSKQKRALYHRSFSSINILTCLLQQGRTKRYNQRKQNRKKNPNPKTNNIPHCVLHPRTLWTIRSRSALCNSHTSRRLMLFLWFLNITCDRSAWFNDDILDIECFFIIVNPWHDDILLTVILLLLQYSSRHQVFYLCR